jgi:DNA-directed RNA polymerase specialized sigma24 family protein
MEILNDAHIIEQLRLGNKEAFEAVFKKYYKLLNVSAFYILQDEMEAEDIVQVFLLIFGKDNYMPTLIRH